jgi:hypothetical protein
MSCVSVVIKSLAVQFVDNRSLILWATPLSTRTAPKMPLFTLINYKYIVKYPVALPLKSPFQLNRTSLFALFSLSPTLWLPFSALFSIICRIFVVFGTLFAPSTLCFQHRTDSFVENMGGWGTRIAIGPRRKTRFCLSGDDSVATWASPYV